MADTLLVGAWLVGFVVGIAVVAVVGVIAARRQKDKPDAQDPVPVVRPNGVPPGGCGQLTEVWHVVTAPTRSGPTVEPYFAARCNCDWVGPARDAGDPDACEKATADAFSHSGNVAPTVVRPLD